MFVFELARTLAWGSLEILFYSTLPSFLDEVRKQNFDQLFFFNALNELNQLDIREQILL